MPIFERWPLRGQGHDESQWQLLHGTRRVLCSAHWQLGVNLWLLAAFAFSLFARDPWDGLEFYWAVDENVKEYCEHINLNANLRTPLNSYSNVCYAAAGVLVLLAERRARGLPPVPLSQLLRIIRTRCGGTDEQEPRGDENDENGENDNMRSAWFPWPQLTAFACFCLSVGSFLFHASLTRAGQHADIAGLHFVLNCLLFMLLWRKWGRLRPLQEPRARAASLAACGVCSILLGVFAMALDTTIVMGVQLLALVSALPKDQGSGAGERASLCACARPFLSLCGHRLLPFPTHSLTHSLTQH